MGKKTLDESELATNPRATLRAWERYHDTVRIAFERFPTVLTLDPDTLSPSTFESRIRDAIRGAIVFDYPRAFAPGPELSEWWNKVYVKRIDIPPRVIIAPRGHKKLSELSPRDVNKPETLEFRELTYAEWHAFCLLVNNGRLSGPIIIRSSNNQPANELESYLNIQLLPRPDGSIILL